MLAVFVDEDITRERRAEEELKVRKLHEARNRKEKKLRWNFSRRTAWTMLVFAARRPFWLDRINSTRRCMAASPRLVPHFVCSNNEQRRWQSTRRRARNWWHAELNRWLLSYLHLSFTVVAAVAGSTCASVMKNEGAEGRHQILLIRIVLITVNIAIGDGTRVHSHFVAINLSLENCLRSTNRRGESPSPQTGE